jgi:hypothetical protein
MLKVPNSWGTQVLLVIIGRNLVKIFSAFYVFRSNKRFHVIIRHIILFICFGY